jgi:hypothetical protein
VAGRGGTTEALLDCGGSSAVPQAVACLLWTVVVTKQNVKTTVAHAGLEPATFALLARRSNQLS